VIKVIPISKEDARIKKVLKQARKVCIVLRNMVATHTVYILFMRRIIKAYGLKILTSLPHRQLKHLVVCRILLEWEKYIKYQQINLMLG